MITRPLAVTLDWYGTLASHRNGVGRGKQFAEHLASNGLKGDPWNRQVLYDVFDYYADAYRPEASDEQKRSFWIEFTHVLFQRSNVQSEALARESHSEAIRAIFGPTCFALFEEAEDFLRSLKALGLRLAIVSNWHRGLDHFCHELGIAPYLDAIVSSADVGAEKPDSRVFSEALRKLSVPPQHALHVGDSIRDDYEGAIAVGMEAILLDRDDAYPVLENRIRNLYELQQLLVSMSRGYSKPPKSGESERWFV